MIKHFMKEYAMTENGARNLKKSIFSHTLLNLTKMFPPLVGFLYLAQYLSVSEYLSATPQLTLIQYIGIILAFFLIMFFVARRDYVNLYENVYNESAQTRIDIANRLKRLPLSYFGKRDLSDLSSTIMSDIELYEQIFSHAVPHMYAIAISTGIFAASLLISNWKLGISVLWVIPVSLLLFSLSTKRQEKAYEETLHAMRTVHDDVQENLDNISEIKSYNLEARAAKTFEKKVDALARLKIGAELAASVGIGIATIILKFGVVSVAVVGVNMLSRGEIHILYFIGYLMLSSGIYQSIESFLTTLSMILMMKKVVGRIKEIKTMPIQEGETNVEIDHYDIAFEDVVFGYEDYNVINGVSFTAKQGEVTALIGASGSGKTTLTKLAARFWDIDGGRILLGGKDISRIDPEELLTYFSIVFQDVSLFNASIRDNIRIGKRGATEEEILRAAKIARCDEFINRMPDGIDSIIGENGERLSGGERQRISIARAVLKDAPIILLDEATASLDVENESLIQEALSELTKEKTVIVIAHRMRTIRGADKIVVLDEGKIESIGNHEELMRNSQIYRKMLKKSGILRND